VRCDERRARECPTDRRRPGRARCGRRRLWIHLIGEKLLTFAKVARDHPEFAAELPKFLAAIYRVFNQFEIAGYVASRKPAARRVLRQLLLMP